MFGTKNMFMLSTTASTVQFSITAVLDSNARQWIWKHGQVIWQLMSLE